MTNAVQTNTAEQGAPAATGPAPATSSADAAPAGWEELRANPEIQFEEFEIVPPPPPVPQEPREPSWFSKMVGDFFVFMEQLFAPIGQMLGLSWPVLQWVLLGLLAVFVLYLLVRTIGPIAQRIRIKREDPVEPEWEPDREESIALLDDADRLAAEGRYDEATHLLLQRSVGQIAKARPDWVEPSSTARELAALPALSEKARTAFATISERVERSLFALRSLDRSDWEAARSAYANFALAKIEAQAA